MAQPLNARGTFFGGGNRGFGTIIRREEQGTFADSGLRVAQRMKAEEEARRKEKKDTLAELRDIELPKAEDIFSPYMDASTSMLNEIIDEYANGKINDAQLTMRVNEYRGMVNKGNQMKGLFEETVKLYEDDPTINAAAASRWLRQQAAGDGSPEYLSKTSIEGLNNLGFLDMEGGSAFLETQKVISQITNNVATDIRQRIIEGDTSWMGNNIVMDKQQMNTEFSRIFEEVVTNNGIEYRLKNPNDPSAREIVDSALQDKRFSRIVYDQLREDSPDKETFTKDEARNKAIRILGGYSPTEITQEDVSETMGVRFAPQRRGGGKGDDVDADERRTEWYKHLMSGQPDLVNNALNYLTGTTNVPFTDLREIISSDTLASLNRTYDSDDLTSASFDIKRGYLKNGEPTIVLVPKESISKKGGLFGTGLFAGSLEEGRPIEVSVDLNSSQSQEFWNNYYNIANTYSTTGEKAHYNENKGGQIGGATPTAPATPTTPSAPTTSSQSGGGRYDNIGQ